MENKHRIDANHIILIEGMDMVGKDTFIQKRIPSYYDTYTCRHQLTDDTVGRNRSWVVGYGVIDYLEQLMTSPSNNNLMNLMTVINRGVFSSYVYGRLYSNQNFDPKILEWYKNNDFFKNTIEHIYIKHHNIDTAKYIFERSQSRAQATNLVSRKLDTFNSFSDYWVRYSQANLLFKEVYDIIGIKPQIFETLPNFEWNEVSEF